MVLHRNGLERIAMHGKEPNRKAQRARIVSIRVPVSFRPMQRLAMTRTGKHDIAVNRRVTHGFEKMRMAPSRSAMQCPINPEIPMTTSELVLQTLSGHHEQSVGQLHKKLAGQPGISNSKSVSNALMRLKKDGRVTNTFDADRAIWLWRVVKEGEVAPQSECQADHAEHDLEMASDVAEVEQQAIPAPQPATVEVKAEHKPLTARQLLDAFEESGESFQGDLCDFRLFSAGAEFAEKHHGIGQ